MSTAHISTRVPAISAPHWILRVVLVLANLSLALFAVNSRRRHLYQILAGSEIEVAPGFEGLAVNTAVAILALSFAVILLITHSLARFVDNRWTGSGPALGRRPATLGVHFAVFSLFGAAILTDTDVLALGRILPSHLFVGVSALAAATGVWTQRGGDRRRLVTGALTALIFVLLTAMGVGRWF